MYLPQVMRPVPAVPGPSDAGVDRIAEAPLSVVRGSPGSYVAERLAAAVESWGRWQNCVWLRPQDTRLCALAESLTSACVHRWDEPVQGWPHPEQPAPEQLVETIRRAPAGAVVVLELGGSLVPGLRRLLEPARCAAADRGTSVVVVTENRLTALALRRSDRVVSTMDLLDQGAVDGITGPLHRHRARLLSLTRGRAAMLHDVLVAARVSAEAVADALDGSPTPRSLLDRVTANLLDQATPAQLAALEVCASSGYWHPRLATRPVAVAALRPWVVPLEGGWGWLRPLWARSLDRQLGSRADRRHRVAPPAATLVDARIDPPDATLVDAPAATRTAAQQATLQARLFGTFELRLDGRAVTTWAGQRGTSVLRYLLSRERHSCSRDELLEEFWPDAGPDAARNRLQVAVSGLRRALREITNLNVITYAEGSYRINPALSVSVDVEQFEQALSAARRAERAQDREGALVAYHEAIRLYRGEFAADAPYEQWTMLPRESLRITYVDALDRVSRIQLGMGQLEECIATGRRMLDVDPCREDAHRMLMYCYARQGRIYQAVRQFEFCCRVLQATLETGPAAETVELFRAVRAGSVREPALT